MPDPLAPMVNGAFTGPTPTDALQALARRIEEARLRSPRGSHVLVTHWDGMAIREFLDAVAAR